MNSLKIVAVAAVVAVGYFALTTKASSVLTKLPSLQLAPLNTSTLSTTGVATTNNATVSVNPQVSYVNGVLSGTGFSPNGQVNIMSWSFPHNIYGQTYVVASGTAASNGTLSLGLDGGSLLQSINGATAIGLPSNQMNYNGSFYAVDAATGDQSNSFGVIV